MSKIVEMRIDNIVFSVNNDLKDAMPENERTEVIHELRYSIVHCVIFDAYKAYIDTSFFDDLLDIYLSGSIPAGYDGKYPRGKLRKLG